MTTDTPAGLRGLATLLGVAAKRLRIPDSDGIPAGPITANELDAFAATIPAILAERDELARKLAEAEALAARNAEDAIRRALTALANQFDELGTLAYEEDERTRRDIWTSAAQQARARAKQPDWIAAALTPDKEPQA